MKLLTSSRAGGVNAVAPAAPPADENDLPFAEILPFSLPTSTTNIGIRSVDCKCELSSLSILRHDFS